MLINALFIIQMLFSVYTLSVVLVLPAKERDISENIKKNRKYLSKNDKIIPKFDKIDTANVHPAACVVALSLILVQSSVPGTGQDGARGSLLNPAKEWNL